MNEAKSPKVTVLDVKLVSAGNLRALAKIQIGPLQICDLRVIQQGEQKAYVSPPQAEFQISGKRCFKPLLSYPESWKIAIEEAVLREWEQVV